MRDKDGKLAPVAYVPPMYPGSGIVGPTEAERLEKERLAAEAQAISGSVGKSVPEITAPIVRGFGEDYREFPDEMQTDLDVEKLIYDIKNSGPEVCHSLYIDFPSAFPFHTCQQDVFTTCYSSLDAGHYLGDFIYFCSLAEAKRTTTKKGKSSKVLFVHCPPKNLPLSSGDVAEALRRIIIWICSKMD